MSLSLTTPSPLLTYTFAQTNLSLSISLATRRNLSTAEAVIEGLERLLIMGASKSAHRCIAVRVDLGPNLCGELEINVLLDSAIQSESPDSTFNQE
jgi:hypothetical protein